MGIFYLIRHSVRNILGNIVLVCALVSLGLFIGELIWYKILKNRR